MHRSNAFLASVSLAFGLVAASPAPQQLNFDVLDAAPSVANGPIDNGIANQTASLYTTFASPTAVLTAPTAGVKARDNIIEKRALAITQSQTITSYSASLGSPYCNTTVSAGVLYWLNGGCTHNFFGNIDNSGNIVVSQTSYLAQNPYASGQTSDWVGHDVYNGNLLNRVGGSIQLNDIDSRSAPTYDWYLRSILNNGTVQMCGRGDTGGSTYQVYSDLDSVNNGLLSFEQAFNNYGASFNWRNTILTTSNTIANLYNNGAVRLINTVFINVQNIYGTGCWQIGKGGVLYLQDGTGVYQNPTNGPSFPGQSISFQDSSAVLHMDTAVYSKNCNFGARVYGFASGNAIEFYEWIWSYSYSATTGILTVTMWSRNTVNINVGLGYDPTKFYQARNPQKYNWIGYNAIWYNGAAPSQSAPAQCSISAPICGNLGSYPPAASATGYVTRTTTGPAGVPFTTTTVAPSGTVSGTVIIITPSAPSYVTTTSTGPATGALTTTTVSPSGTNAGTVIIITPSAAPSYVTKTSTGPATGALTTTTVAPSGTAPGTVIVITPSAAPSYVTTTSTGPATGALTTTTVAPSGTAPGTVIVITPSAAPSYVTTTSTGPATGALTTTTVAPSGTAPGTVIVITPSMSITSTTSQYTPYYPALATSYTTDPALTGTTTAGQACATQPEAGTYCGFINPEDPCAPQPDGYGPVPTPDTASAFLAYPPFASMATSAPTVVPASNGAQYIETFVDLNASSSAQSYLGLLTLKTYDVAGCAAACDAKDLCTAFNIYIQRDPSLNPSTNASYPAYTVWGYNCPNPPSMTSFKCTLWGSNLDASTATNYGEQRVNFTTVITGSNGYDKTNSTTPVVTGGGSSSSSSSSIIASTASSATSTLVSTSSAIPTTLQTMTSAPFSSSASSASSAPASSSASPIISSSTSTSTSPASTSTSCPWSKPQNCHGQAISAPNHWLGSKFFPGPFNAQICSQYALLQNLANKQAAAQQGSSTYSTCSMFNAYYIHKNGAPAGTVCSMYDTVLDSSWATYGGGYSKSGDRYDCKQSWTWQLQI